MPAQFSEQQTGSARHVIPFDLHAQRPRHVWPHVRAILEATTADKELLLAAIAAAASIKRDEAEELFANLDDSDAEIASAIDEALTISGALDDSLVDDED